MILKTTFHNYPLYIKGLIYKKLGQEFRFNFKLFDFWHVSVTFHLFPGS